MTLSNLAASYLEHGRLEDALARNAEAIRIGLALDPVPQDVAIWSANRVVYLYTAGRTEDAVITAQEGIARAGAALGTDHPAMANLYANLGAILMRLNRPHDAMAPIRQAFELIEQANGGPNQNSATMRTQFAQALVRAGRNAGAIAFLDHATPIIDAQLGAQSDRSLSARDTRLAALIALGRGRRPRFWRRNCSRCAIPGCPKAIGTAPMRATISPRRRSPRATGLLRAMPRSRPWRCAAGCMRPIIPTCCCRVRSFCGWKIAVICEPRQRWWQRRARCSRR